MDTVADITLKAGRGNPGMVLNAFLAMRETSASKPIQLPRQAVMNGSSRCPEEPLPSKLQHEGLYYQRELAECGSFLHGR